MNKKKLDKLWKTVRNYHKVQNPLIYEEMITTPMATSVTFDKIEKLIGVKLPEIFKYNYQLNNTNSTCSIFGENVHLNSIEEIYDMVYKNKNLWTDKNPFPYYSNKIISPQVTWHKEWIRFADLYSEEIFILDFRDAMKDRKGSVINLDNTGFELTFSYNSFENFLEDAINQLVKNGEYDLYPLE